VNEPSQLISPDSIDRSAAIQEAQRYVGAAMAVCLGLWFAPVVSGALCSQAESLLIDKILRILECESDQASEALPAWVMPSCGSWSPD
jgi:hypothetical protein